MTMLSRMSGRWTETLGRSGAVGPTRRALASLQLNLGRYCNIKCVHCHVNAGPERATEVMDDLVREKVLAWIERHRPPQVDLTGGAPELIAGFREIVRFCRERDLHVMDRCNLVCLLEPGQEDLAAFLAEHRVEVVASLPCYSRENVDRQRGDGVFDGSIEGIRRLNAVGYGAPGGPLLQLIYNPVGAHLPPDQSMLEADYKERLATDFGLVFNRLWCLTNMPIARYATQLLRDGQWERYWALLSTKFQPGNLDGLMCRTTLAVHHDGVVSDCDFNLMLRLPLGDRRPQRLWDLEPAAWGAGAPIAYRDHCLGCTAGAGSSCGGQLG